MKHDAFCVFTGIPGRRMKEETAHKKGYLKDIDDLTQIRENKYVYDGNNSYWTLLIDDKRYIIKRK